MKQLSLSIAVLAVGMFAASCGRPASQGQLTGDYTKLNYKAPTPMGMVYVPTGVMKAGYSDQDVDNSMDAKVRTFNITGFYMDATEITNAEYRQFTSWVRDSIAHATLGDYKDNDDGSQSIDWSHRINWEDQDVQDQLMGMYIDASLSGSGKKEMKTSSLLYGYKYYDYDEAVQHPDQPATNFMVSKTINVYPDTLVWARQFNYSNNDPMSKQYNWFPAFNEYPVVGVNWHQANAFCNWRTTLWKNDREGHKQYFEGKFSLPTETEWEWAARGGRELSPYPWGGAYVLNQKGCYLANFKPNRGDYSADGGLYTVRANAYWPNDYGLYNMSGNVAEWTSSSYYIESYNKSVLSDLNPNIKVKILENDAAWQKRKSVKGGSWRDTYDYLNISNRDYEFADTAKAYIGFRCIYGQLYPALYNEPNKKR